MGVMRITEKKTKNLKDDPKEDPFTEDPKEDHVTEDYIKNYYNRILASKEFIPFLIIFFYQLILGKGISGTPASLVPYVISQLYVM